MIRAGRGGRLQGAGSALFMRIAPFRLPGPARPESAPAGPKAKEGRKGPTSRGDVMGVEGRGAAGFLTGFAVGSRIAGYRLEEQIGRGGMAVVFRAQDERLNRQVALKVLAPALAADEDFRHRFIRESRSAAAVDDPHIIPVFEAGEADEVLFIAMRYVPGGDVRALLRRLGPLPTARAAGIISAVASALDAAHAAGLVHRDVKPANMLVDVRPGRPDHVYLSDFGLTKVAVSSASVTGAGLFLGTLDYCAPEQIRGQQVDARTDEYALACAVFTLMSGTPPFHRDDAMAVLYAQLSDPPPRSHLRRPDLPPAVDDVLQRALPRRRPTGTPAAESSLMRCVGVRTPAVRLRLGGGAAPAVVTDHQHRLGLDHADKLAADASVAAARQEARRSDEAVARRQQALTDQQQNLGPDHPDTLATRFSLARQMAARGEHTGAENGFRGVFAARERTLGADHPDTLATRFASRRRWRRAATTPGRRTSSGTCSRPGSGRWGRTIRTRWPPGLRSRRRWRRAAITPGPRMSSGTCSRPGSGRWGRIIRTRWPPGSRSRRRWRRAATTAGRRTGSGGCSRPGSGRWARIIRTRWPPGSRSLRRWRRRAITPGPRTVPGGVRGPASGRWGADHPDTLATRFAIAQQMAARGDHAGAEKEFRHVLAGQQRTLGRITPTR